MANGDAQAVIKSELQKAEALVKTNAALGANWRDWQKPLGARRAPNPVPFPIQAAAAVVGYGTHPQKFQKGSALKSTALSAGLAHDVQHTITVLADSLNRLPEPKKTINMVYLRKVADATVAAGRACQQLRRGQSPSKNETRLACAWVVCVGCGFVPRLDQRVKEAAIKAYPLFSAGKRLNETVAPSQAIHVGYVALDVA